MAVPATSNVEKLRETVEAGKKRLEAAAAAPFAAPETGGLFGRGGTLGLGLGADPWQTTMERTVNPWIQNQALPQWAKTGSQYVLPQNAPELALTALTLPLGGAGGVVSKALTSPAARIAAATGLKGAEKGIGVLGRAALKGLEGGAAAGLTGKATGHDALTSAVGGAAGGAGGSLVGETGALLSQVPTVKRIVDQSTQKLQEGFRTLLGGARVPANEAAEATVQRVLAGDVVKEVEKDVAATLGNRYNVNPKGFETDPDMIKLGQQAIKDGVSDIFDKTGKKLSLKKMWENLPAARAELATRWFSPAAQQQFADETQRLTGATLVQDLVREAQAKTANFFDKTGKLTAEGLGALQEGFHGKLAALGQYFKPDEIKALATALGQDVAGGLQKGVAGVLPEVSLNLQHLMLPTVKGARLPWQPGWEAARSGAAKLGEGAAAAGQTVAAEAPSKVLGGGRGPAPPKGEAPPVAPEPAWTAPFRPTLPPPSVPIEPPTPVGRADQREAPNPEWFVPPPPDRPQPPTASAPLTPPAPVPVSP
jgi:hypothetical protein